jgi:hypothetical protein
MTEFEYRTVIYWQYLQRCIAVGNVKETMHALNNYLFWREAAETNKTNAREFYGRLPEK